MSSSSISSPLKGASTNANGHHRPSATATRKKIEVSSDEDDVPLAKKPKREPSTNGSSTHASSSKPNSSSANGKAKATIKKEDGHDSDSDVPLKRAKPSTAAGSKRPPPNSSSSSKIKAEESSDDEDEDAPLRPSKKTSTLSKASDVRSKKHSNGSSKAARMNSPRGKTKSSTPDDDEEEEEEEEEEEDDGEEDEDGEGNTSSNKGNVKHTGDGGQMWSTLYHSTPRFPPAYEALPSDVKLKYDGKPVRLPPEAEEAALFYAVKLETIYVQDPVFNNNFFKDFKQVLKKYPPLDGTEITDFKKLDFSHMCDYQKGVKEEEKERKKKLAPSARKKETENKKALEEEMKSCLVDGKKQRVGNVLVEPPALFMGRGQHPKRGMIKPRVQPEEITINHTLNDPAHPPPAPPAGHRWKSVVEYKDVTWLAHWVDFNGNYKYVYLDSTSSFKSNSDRDKFEKARKLDKCIKKLRKTIDEMLVSKSRQERQLGTVVWLIDNYSLRAGNEKGEDEAATYGVCSLLVEHVKELVDAERKVQLEFLGKDSMLFKETLEVPERIFKNIKMFATSTKNAQGVLTVKKSTDAIFDRVDTSDVNKFLRDPSKGGMPGLSAKVFRTYNASTTFQGLLNKTADNLEERSIEATPQTLKDEYMQANRLVAILCNHQKTINPQVAERATQRASEKMIALKYDIHKERQKILTVHKTVKDVKKEYPQKDHKEFDWSKFLEEDLELTEEDIKDHEERLINNKISRLESAFERQEAERAYQMELARSGSIKKEEEVEEVKPKGKPNKKQPKRSETPEEEDGKPKVIKIKTAADVAAEKKALEDLLRTLEKERKTGKAVDVDAIKVDVCARKIKSKFDQIKKFEADLDSKNKTSDVSLGTSKLNYIDPRITVAWLKKWDAILVAQDGAVAKKMKSKAKEEDEEDTKKDVKSKKGPAAVKKEKTGEPDKLDLQLQKLPIGGYFPMTMQKKFKWADYSDLQEPGLPSTWEFVPDATAKIRDNMSSARRQELQDEVAETRKDDASKAGKKGPAKPNMTKKSADKVIESGTGGGGGNNGAGKREKPPSSKRKLADEEKEKEEEDSDSDLPLGKKR